MQPTIVKTSEAFDFLALVPQLVGFQPEQSMVLVAFRGNRTCGALRFNLPEADAAAKVLRRIATTLIGTLCKIPGVDAVVPVAYTGESFTEANGIPQERFMGCLVKRAEMSGFLVRDALCVGADAWGSYLDPHCPASGRSLGFITDSRVHEPPPPGARGSIGTLASGTELPRVSPAQRERVAREYRRYAGLHAPSGPPAELLPVVGEVLDSVDIAEDALTWDTAALHANVVARLVFVLQGAGNRDQVMLQFAFGREVGENARAVNQYYWALQAVTGRDLDDLVIEQHQRGISPEAAVIGDLMLGLTDQRPDPERIERGIALLKLVVASAPRPTRTAPLCMLAWLSWALGRGSVAAIFIDRALAIDPSYGMAVLLHRMLSSGLLPDWVYMVPAAGHGDRGEPGAT
ncbi:DUF4192 domain-containing protein [Cryobacterium psychrophilum]|uniref:DUF4192 family protein n=1 Tax=Cryobacterium psychrophilum TaxID=41988 RepID=A0A4Y8KQZ3_9MICO|nr:DUF4192 domain-containing protein [Cryobacterium psychrophilum]TDW29154.1 uncharacterized protein DUF4192 [Cryobacterium psychrophilum]TFD77816.1 DUF4192 family protein [Cryobacterium psychrophilum]